MSALNICLLKVLVRIVKKISYHHITNELWLAKTIIDKSKTALHRISPEGKVLYVNDYTCQSLGYTREELTSMYVWEFDPDFSAEIWTPWWEKLKQTGVDNFETRHQHKNGTIFPVEVTANYILHNGQEYSFALAHNITERKRLEQREHSRNHVLEQLAKGASLKETLEALVHSVEQEDPTILCSILLLDDKGKHLLIGAAPSLPVFYNTAIHGIEIGQDIGSCGTTAYTGMRCIVEDIQTHPYWIKYKELAAKAGLAACWSEPIKSSQGKVLGTFALYHREIASPNTNHIKIIQNSANLASIAIEHHLVRTQLEQQARIDYLTCLVNRRYFFELAEKELLRTLRYGNPLSLLMLDIDFFKKINDTYGHKAGDSVLHKLGSLCQEELREVDIYGRLGGEEFAIVLPETDSTEALEVAERLRNRVELTEVPVDSGLPVRFTISIGIAGLTNKETSIDMLLNQADQMLYEAKHAGRNRVCIAR